MKMRNVASGLFGGFLVVSLTACGEQGSFGVSESAKHVPAASVIGSSSGDSGANPAGSAQPAPTQSVTPAAPSSANLGAIEFGFIPAGVEISCDHFNPTAIRNLKAETILWLASLVPSGLTLHEHYLVARDLGYEGGLGRGGHAAWMLNKPGRQAAFDRMSNAFANQATAPYLTFRDHHTARRAAGYQGLFLCGGDICFREGRCDSLGRLK